MVDSRAELRARIFAVAEQIRNHPDRIASAIQSLLMCWKMRSKWRWTLWTATLKQILWDKCTTITCMCSVRYNNRHVIPKFQYACFLLSWKQMLMVPNFPRCVKNHCHRAKAQLQLNKYYYYTLSDVCSVFYWYSFLCIVIPYLRFFRVFPSVVGQMPGYNS